MAATYGPRATFDLPSGSDAAKRIAATAGVEDGEAATWQKNDEAPDDVRSALYDAIRAEFDGWGPDWELYPRRVEKDGARLEVTFAPVVDVYSPEDELPEVQPGPRQRLLATLDEFHHELDANMVKRSDLLDETEGDVDTLLEELNRLEQEGEVYQPDESFYRRTGA